MKQLSSKQLIGTILAVVFIIVAGVTMYAIVSDRDDSRAPTSQTQDSDTTAPPTNQQQPPAVDDSSAADISMQEAEKIALDEFGGTVQETKSDDYQDTPAWEVEIRDSREGQIEVKVDKQTGEVLHWEHDD